MKKIILLTILLCSIFSTSHAQTYNNTQYHFVLWLPDDFKQIEIPAPYWIVGYESHDITTFIGIINTNGNYGYEYFNNTPQEKINLFLNVQLLVSEKITPQFKFITSGKDYTLTNKKYVYMLFLTEVNGYKAVTARTYFKDGGNIIAIFHTFPYPPTQKTADRIDNINRSLSFLSEIL